MLMWANHIGLGFNSPKTLNQMLRERKREKDAERDRRIGQSQTRGLIDVFLRAGATVVAGDRPA
ncbi:hypothetical protein [uncultured Alsobacter sp.]|uniref:hypothetical protein n=1 Tax=uncultured Alsobacter sp. TaxID=1748258 RepID=UPI0025DF2BCD|nr:hypothetical protein [uncultured Alsobacter sp.]